VAPTKVVEIRYDHFGDGRFRHGCTFLRVREDKLPKDCLLEQVVAPRRIQQASTDGKNLLLFLALSTLTQRAAMVAAWELGLGRGGIPGIPGSKNRERWRSGTPRPSASCSICWPIPKTCLVRLSGCAGKLSNDSSRIGFLGPHHSTYRPARRT
jgi:hypothetical protein